MDQGAYQGGGQDGFSSEGLRGTQRQGVVAPIPIAIPAFTGDDPKLAQEVAQVLMADLERSGLFQPLDPALHRGTRELQAARDFRGRGAGVLAEHGQQLGIGGRELHIAQEWSSDRRNTAAFRSHPHYQSTKFRR